MMSRSSNMVIIIMKKLLLAASLSLCSAMSFGMNEAPFHVEKLGWSSGNLYGYKNLNEAGDVNPTETKKIHMPGAAWVQLDFTGTTLGADSYLEVVSVKDGSSQRLSAKTLAEWDESSAFFNGDAVTVNIYIDEADQGAEVQVASVKVGEFVKNHDSRSICGVDNRVASSESRVGRIDPLGCTGWVASNGTLLTAGHCLSRGSSNRVLSFNPPASLPDGTVQFPPASRQYSINQSSFNYTNGGVGNDWGVFTVYDNSVTGLQPVQAYGGFTLRRDRNARRIRITGFGVDSGSTNQTNQTHVGDNAGSSGNTMRYTADTMGGNSGSPIIDSSTGRALGIHTHGGCYSSGGNNHGTSFYNSQLWNAAQ